MMTTQAQAAPISGNTQLTQAQADRLASLLRNESDVAYKRRVRTMLAYLELAPGLTVLDCGTGMGFYLMTIATLFPATHLCGVDLESRVLGYARDHLRGSGALVTRGDVQNLALASESVDRVLMSEVLEHLPDDAAALREVYRVLKPGGILAVTVPHRHYSFWYDPINRIAEGIFRRPIRRGPFAGIWANHERLYLLEEVRAVIQDAGFAIEKVEELTHYCFPGTQTIVYTIGKGLIEHNLLPEAISRSTHRFRGDENRSSRWNPLNWALALFNWVDGWNENAARLADKRTFVNIAVKARKV